MRKLLALGALALLLSSCGRVGDVRPPGPPAQVTYPPVYPNRCSEPRRCGVPIEGGAFAAARKPGKD